ncbi:MAG: pyruvate kinase alpha/beta domain-containing protein [Anaerolineae bacterium]
MRSIVEEAEKHFPYREFFEKEVFLGYHDVSSSVALASVQTGYSTGARAIFVFTCSGSTARSVSRFRPQMPIIALTPSVKTYHQLAINWGVIPVDPTSSKNATEAFATTIEFAKKHGIVHYGDLVVVTDGVPFGVSGTTNRMLVDSIGDVLVRGQKGYGEEIHGRVVILASSEGHLLSEVRGRIMVISRYDESYAPLAKEALGIVLQSHPEDIDSEEKAMSFAKMLGLPILARADGALTLLKEGQLVTLDPIRGIVYKGPVNL